MDDVLIESVTGQRSPLILCSISLKPLDPAFVTSSWMPAST